MRSAFIGQTSPSSVRTAHRPVPVREEVPRNDLLLDAPRDQFKHPRFCQRSPAGLDCAKLFRFRARRPARAVRSGGTHVSEARWRATTVLDQITMSSTRHKSRIRAIRPRLRSHMMPTTTGPRFSMPGRPRSTSRLLINPTTACHSIIPPLTTRTPSSLTQPTSPATHRPGTWDTRGRRTLAPAPRPMLSWRLSTLL